MPAEDAPARIPLSESLGLSEQNLLALVGVASALVLALIVVIWRTGPAIVDDVPQPVVVAGAVPAAGAAPQAATTAAVPVPASAAAPTVPPGDRAAAADSMRSGGAAFAIGENGTPDVDIGETGDCPVMDSGV